ncbi:MAG: hypothetical protein GY805_29740, partial [Chloroflexi bacterium]|nr:hypothetical protein [Chloroflexota bacterium]
MTTKSNAYLSNLHQLLNQHFNLAEIRTLCLDLNIDYESVAGEEKPSRIRELLLGLARNGRLPQLLKLVEEKKPRVQWPPLPDKFQLPESLLDRETAVAEQHNFYGDKIGKDKIDIGSISQESAVAVGAGSSVTVNKGYSPEEIARLIAEMTQQNQLESPSADPAAHLLQTYHKESVIKLS